MADAGLTKALILNMQTNEQIPVMYNPEEFKLEQGNNFAEVGIPGLNMSPIQYVRGKARTLAMDLFFDTYESPADRRWPAGTDVRQYTGQIVRLLDKLPDTQAPPVLLFALAQFQFQCVLVDVNQRFTMFLRDGTPVRATLSVRFQEYVRVDVQIQTGFFFGPPTLITITKGKTLSALAYDYLGDPSLWRQIADANNIEDPLNIPPGTPLTIPRAARLANPGGPRP
ncbi:MAG TPA: LysM peptidoglycan-binding domain-containing protein [Gemmataceae bacterium]|jgi:nucleoid-associated protein YgaU